MNKLSFFLFSFIVLVSCSQQTKVESSDNESKTSKPETLEEIVNHHVESQLSIPSNEKYNLKIYKEHLDGDDKIDAIITLNRMEYALLESRKSGNLNLIKELDYTGPYNYIFYFDGGLNQISPAITITSSPQAELTVSFENILTAAVKDVLVDYKIRNSSFRNYYSIQNHTPKQVFQWKIYDYLGEQKTEANFIEYENGTVGLAKDIVIYEGNLENESNVKDIYHFEPQITKKDKRLFRFFYLENEGKYFTKK